MENYLATGKVKIMFTGIIQEIGQVKSISRNTSEIRIEIDLKNLLVKNDSVEIGESISINGACHTLEKLSKNRQTGSFFSSLETLEKTNFRYLKEKSPVNLELPVKPNSFLGGHFLAGHVDCMAKFISSKKIKESYLIQIEVPESVKKYLVYKGSVALNGISLTVAKIEMNSCVFSVAVIPHTWEKTNLKDLRVGDLMNLETDLIAKYLEKLLLLR